MRVRRILIAIVAVAGWAASGLALPATAATILTVTATGVIEAGKDDGTLTASGGDLAGASVTMVLSYIVTPTYLEFPGNPGIGVFDSIGVAITVGAGPTYTLADSSTASGIVQVQSGVPSFLDAQGTLQDGTASLIVNASVIDAVTAIIASAEVLEDRVVFPSASPDTVFSFGAFYLADGGVVPWEFLVSEVSAFKVSVTGRDTEVPEPAAMGLFAIGLAGLALGRRRHLARHARLT